MAQHRGLGAAFPVALLLAFAVALASLGMGMGQRQQMPHMGAAMGGEHAAMWRHSNAHNGDRILRFLECRAGITRGCAKPQPFVQLKRKVTVCMCPNNYDHAFDNFIREGLQRHPQVTLVNTDQHEEADYVLYIPDRQVQMREQEGKSCPGPFPNKTLVLDEEDWPTHLDVPHEWTSQRGTDYRTHWNEVYVLQYLAGFKRSFVWKDTSQYDKQMLGFRLTASERPSFFPIQYGIRSSFIPDTFPKWEERDLAMSTVLRPDFYQDGTKKDGARAMTQNYFRAYVDEHNITNFHHGAPSNGGRGEGDRDYFAVLRASKIVATCNPSFWEGDHRTGEALISGALVLVDHMWSPRPYPLIDHWHLVYFDPANKADFTAKLHYYHTHEDEARIIAARGTYHVQRYMNSVTTVDYVLTTGEQLLEKPGSEDYIRTGPIVVKDYDNLYSLQQKELYPFRRRLQDRKADGQGQQLPQEEQEVWREFQGKPEGQQL